MQLLQTYLTCQSNQCKMNTSTKFSNISISEKAKNLKHITFLFMKRNNLISTEMRYKPCFNGYNGINRSHKTL